MSGAMPACGSTLRSGMAACVVAGLMSACVTTAVPRRVEAGIPVRLARDIPVTLPDRSVLTYEGLGADSRCPRDAYCIHAGSVQVRFRHAASRSAAALPVLLVAPRTASADLGTAWRLVLVDVDGVAHDAATVRIDPRR